MIIDVDAYTDTGGRPENEDDCGFWWWRSRECVTVAVADGLGGQGDGLAASHLVCDSLLNQCKSSFEKQVNPAMPDRETIDALFCQANEELLAKQRNSFHMKTTAVYLCVIGDQAVWAHIGDSRLYHLFNGRISHYTLDHSASQLAVYMGEITRREIPGHAGRNRLLHALGVKDEHPDIHDRIRLESGEHVFLLCTDGLWEYLSDELIENTWNKTKDVKEFIKQIRKEKDSRSPEDCDNNSAVVVHVRV